MLMCSNAHPRRKLATAVVALAVAMPWTFAAPRGAPLIVYEFADSQGALIRDRSGVGEPVDLKIENPKAVSRRPGSIEIKGKPSIRSDRPPKKLIEAVKQSGAITIEAWVEPANTKQDGPARIVTISKNTSERNVTLGQDGDKFDARLRTTKNGKNGTPSLASPSKTASGGLQHVVYTREQGGRARLFIDGKQRAERIVAGDLRNWDLGMRLAIGNELSGDRPWLGEIHLVALYARALEPDEVAARFKAGKDAKPAGAEPADPKQRSRELFVTEIEPILARHCLECHDGTNTKGELDLSVAARALKGGSEGSSIIPGSAAKSHLWEVVQSDEMPKKRAPLTADEKASLKEWVDTGAVFASEAVDPAAHKLAKTPSVYTRRLTVSEYTETVRAATGVEIGAEARELLPPELRADGFSNTAYNMGVDLKHVEAYARLAEIIVGRMDIAAFAKRFSGNRSLTQKKFRPHIEAIGKQLLRAPIDERELNLFHGVSTSVSAAGGDFDESVRFVVQSMLQSPRFAYRIERAAGDYPRPADDYELASRLSYMIWGGPPDGDLLKAADKGELGDTAKISGQVERMLEDPRAVRRSKEFVSEWLHLDRLAHMAPNAKRFPKWSPELARDMRAETLAFFEDVVWRQRRPMSDLLNAQVTLATPQLATHYGLDPKAGQAAGGNLLRFDLGATPARGGLLTQGSVLTVGGDDASMVTRGLFVLHDLLRGAVKDPPPGVDTTPQPSKPGFSQRRISEVRMADKSCGGCHAKFEPLAFALERYDGVGAHHLRDGFGNDLRQDGEILLPGAAEPVNYNSSAELMDVLAKSDRVAQNITWKIAQFALGRPLAATDRPALTEAHQAASKNGGTYAAVIAALATSDLIRMTPAETEGSNR